MDKCIHGSTLPGCWPCAQVALVDDVTMFKAITSNMSERAQARLNTDHVALPDDYPYDRRTTEEIKSDIEKMRQRVTGAAHSVLTTRELDAIIDPPPMPQIDDNRTGLIDGRVVTLDQLRFFTDPNTTMLVADGRRLRIMYDMRAWTMKRDPLAVAIWTEFEKCEAEIMPRGNLHESLDELRASLDRLQQLCDRHGWHEYKHTLHSG